ncbi:glycosyltransferase family 2 protein [Patescibacteria group bacterium]|nr:glycosyltransferase family 2 protein [Patescibacteria group bacterium]
MRLSVVIPTYNRKDVLIETLKAFSQQSYKNFEVIIVDDGSSDGTKEAINKLNLPFKISYFFQKNKGPASARNVGIKKAQEKIIFFTGDDIIPSPDLLKKHITMHQQGNSNLVVLGYTQWAPQIKITPFRKYIAGYHFNYSAIADKNNVNWRYFYTSNVSVSKDLLEKIGLFDEEFIYAAYEDSELAYRMSKQGMKMVFNKEAIAYHNHLTNFKSYQRTMINKGKSLAILAKKVPQLEKKSSVYETSNPLRYFLKKIIFNNLTLPLLTAIICFLDKISITLPKSFYTKILNYYYLQGIKASK